MLIQSSSADAVSNVSVSAGQTLSEGIRFTKYIDLRIRAQQGAPVKWYVVIAQDALTYRKIPGYASGSSTGTIRLISVSSWVIPLAAHTFSRYSEKVPPAREGKEMARWLEQIPREEREVYEKAGFGQRQSFGKRPALLVIDCTLAFIGSRKHRSVKDAVEEYPTACGPAGWEALEIISSLLASFRREGWPVVYTKLNLEAQRVSGGATKSGRLLDPKGNEIPEEIQPRPDEWVLEKCKASGFFGTPLTTHLVRNHVEQSLI